MNEKEYFENGLLAAGEGRGLRKEILLVREYIEANCRDHITWSELGHSVGMSKEYLRRMYRQATGHTLCEEIRACRMKIAAEMLATTTMRVSEIARDLSIRDASYFSLLFRKTYHCSPREYRDRVNRQRAVRMDGLFKNFQGR